MSARCPAGHETASSDYCDVCGLPVGSGGSPATASSPSPAAVAAGASGGAVLPPPLPAVGKACPHCGTDNLADALFCEDCGYDFTTGTAPRGDEFGPLTPAAPDPAPDPVPDPAPTPDPTPDAGADAPDLPEVSLPDVALAEVNLPEVSLPGADAPDAAQPDAPDAVQPDAVQPDTVQPDAVQPDPPAVAGPPSPAPAVAPTWVAEVWVDPDWYAAQGSSDPCPSAGPPAVVVLGERSVLVGRTSASRNIHPQIDISADPGVSRRHAQLSTDGQRWFVEDLQSANGTYIGSAGAPLPEIPLDPGGKKELDDDDRLYLGAWTRIVLRAATEDEQA